MKTLTPIRAMQLRAVRAARTIDDIPPRFFRGEYEGMVSMRDWLVDQPCLPEPEEQGYDAAMLLLCEEAVRFVN